MSDEKKLPKGTGCEVRPSVIRDSELPKSDFHSVKRGRSGHNENVSYVYELPAGLVIDDSKIVPGDFLMSAEPLRANYISLAEGLDFSVMAVKALEAYQQADADGTTVTVSRQALEEVLPVLRFLKNMAGG